jgi:hypothetical protein
LDIRGFKATKDSTEQLVGRVVKDIKENPLYLQMETKEIRDFWDSRAFKRMWVVKDNRDSRGIWALREALALLVILVSKDLYSLDRRVIRHSVLAVFRVMKDTRESSSKVREVTKDSKGFLGVRAIKEIKAIEDSREISRMGLEIRVHKDSWVHKDFRGM